MKKLYLILFIALLLFSCSDDDKITAPDANPIVKWGNKFTVMIVF